jgi:SNF2 family DNA or RNA helicase
VTVRVDIDSKSDKYIAINAEWRYKELCKSLPGSKWSNDEQTWRVPLSWTSCLALRSTFKDDLELGENLTAWATNELNTRITPSNDLRELEEADGAEDLFPHQRAGVQFLATAKRALLADEPGLGKTAQAIRALKELEDRGEEAFPALIVCPNTLKKNWAREFATWYPDKTVQIIKGTATQRKKQFDTNADVLGTAYNILSVDKLGLGIYKVVYTVPFIDNNYAITTSSSTSGVVTFTQNVETSSADIHCIDLQQTFTDAVVSVVIHA